MRHYYEFVEVKIIIGKNPDSMPQKKVNRRNFLKAGVGAVGAGLAYSSGCAFSTPSSITGVNKKQVLVCSDIHIGYIDDDLDGEEWFLNAISDLNNIGPIDYALVLGDIAHYGQEEEFEKYLSCRKESDIAKWYELAGNHDHGGGGILNYSDLICPDKTYMVFDGNLVWFFLSDEEPGPEGEISESTYVWLKNMILRHQDKIIIVCSHQLVYGTVRDSTVSDRYIYPKEMPAEILDILRIDLWLCGHQHFYPYSHDEIYNNGKTTFINVASLNHAYDTGMSQSLILEIQQDAEEIIAHRRSHDKGLFENEYEISIPVPFPIKTSEPYKEKGSPFIDV